MIPVRSESFKPCKFHIEAVASSNGGNRLKGLSHNHISPLPFGNRCVTQLIVRIQTDFPRHYGCKTVLYCHEAVAESTMVCHGLSFYMGGV